MRMFKSFRAGLLAGFTGLAAVCAAVPAQAHERDRDREYVYYPEREVYYAPRDHYWYWHERDRWASGPRLPSSYGYVRSGGVRVVLDVDRPWVRHDYVVQHYGPPRYAPPPRVVYVDRYYRAPPRVVIVDRDEHRHDRWCRH